MLVGSIYLSWEPGCGKTLPVLLCADRLKGPHLAIVPAHLRLQWAEQVVKHTTLRPVVLRKIDASTRKPGPDDFVICSYEFASRPDYWRKLRTMAWGSITIDEAHYLSNHESNRTRAILGRDPNKKMGLVFAAPRVWLLSGTPFQYPNQAYGFLRRLFPDTVWHDEFPRPMTAREWKERFCLIRNNGFGEKIVGAIRVPELRERIAPALDKLKLREVASELPMLVIDQIPIQADLSGLLDEMPAELLEKYQALVDMLANEDITDDEKLRRVGQLDLPIAALRHHIGALKAAPLVQVAKNELASGVKKLLIFGVHRAPLQEVAKSLNAPLVFGGMSDPQRQAAKNQFIRDPACRVLVGQVSAIGTGVDGLQTVCHRGLFFEASWRHLENQQAVHRLHRVGQMQPVHVSYVTLVGSVDEHVNRVLERKAEVIRQMLD